MTTQDAPRILRAGLVSRLLDLASEIAAAEEDACQAGLELAEVKAQLDERETALLIAGVPGSNTEQRKAHLSALCADCESAVRSAQERQQGAAMRLRTLHAEASILKACARLVEDGDA
jgi:chromosome segregation ATPase